MKVLFEKYTEDTKRFQETWKQLGKSVEIMVWQDDGFLPSGILSPFAYYVSKKNQETHEERELFYDFLEVPEYWEIRLIGAIGGIFDMGVEQAKIYFTEPAEKQIVQRVEWHMEDGWIYKIDYYDKYGKKYASEFLDKEKNVESKVYYSDRNQEVVVIQPQNHVVTLLENGCVSGFFTSYEEFIRKYMSDLEQDEEYSIFIENEKALESLDIRPDGGNTWRYAWFSNDNLLHKYVERKGTNGHRFFAIPESYAENKANGEAFILTGVDWLEKIEELADRLPDVTFHIAAHTQVSEKIYKLAERENVKAYPGISAKDMEMLWNKCDFYLDINHYGEVDDTLNEAYQRNLLIMSFENTIHRRELIAEENIFSEAEFEKMSERINGLLQDAAAMRDALDAQQNKVREIWKLFLESMEG